MNRRSSSSASASAFGLTTMMALMAGPCLVVGLDAREVLLDQRRGRSAGPPSSPRECGDGRLFESNRRQPLRGAWEEVAPITSAANSQAGFIGAVAYLASLSSPKIFGDVVLRALHAVVLELLALSVRRWLRRRSCRPSPSAAPGARNAALNSPNSTQRRPRRRRGRVAWTGPLSTPLHRGGGFLDRVGVGDAAAAVVQIDEAAVAGRARGRRCGLRGVPERR